MSGEYPTEDEVLHVKNWVFTKENSYEKFMQFVKSIGQYWPHESFGWKQRGRTYWVSTGGWSGNEEIIDAMQENFMFWAVCWEQSNKGGHFIFKLPNPKTFFTKEARP